MTNPPPDIPAALADPNTLVPAVELTGQPPPMIMVLEDEGAPLASTSSPCGIPPEVKANFERLAEMGRAALSRAFVVALDQENAEANRRAHTIPCG